ncbi:ankyrin repeat-containing domain protein [Coprinopsis sp. MPI-PUGE-AT-0042]|nr:ankyrin repeat-containing domain protein [Coprinopsis sp. MPI-PUGE-AT-0042]
MTLERIGAQQGQKPQLARLVLSWLTYARRGLTVDDLRYALAVKLTQPLPSNEDILDPLLLVDESVLLSVCCGLVVVGNPVYGIQSLRLVHFTAVDFLKKTISPMEAHLLLASTCIRRIISVETKSTYPSPKQYTQTSQKHPSLGYALDFWAEHGRHCVGPDCGAVVPFVREVAYLFLRRCPIPSAYNDLVLPWTALCTVVWRVPEVVAPLLAMEDPRIVQAVAEQVNSQTPDFHHSLTPLALAVMHPDTQALRALLSLPNIDVNIRTSRGTALMIATEVGNGEAIKLLLANPRVDVNVHQTVARSSTWNGIQGKADPVAHGGVTALILAAAVGSETITRLLLERTDVEVNQANQDGWTPLMFAILNGHLPVVKRLLKHPHIDLDATNSQGETGANVCSAMGESRDLSVAS